MKQIENKKIVLGVLTLVLVFAIIIVSSFWPFILDFERINTREFITEQLILMAITIASLVSMLLIAKVGNAQNPNSEIARAKVEFMRSMKGIANHTSFYQWVKKILQPKDRLEIAETEMLRMGIDFRVWDLSDNEIKSLTLPQKYGDVFYKSLTKKQIRDIFKLKKSIKNVRFVKPNYYTSYSSMAQDKTLSQIASGENVKKVSTVAFQVALKIITTFIGAAIIGSLVRDFAQDGGSTAQAWIRFLSRMFAFFTSMFLGYMTGCKMNDLDAFYIMKRVEVHTLYLEDKDFAPVDEAKEEFRQRCLEEEHKLITRKG